MQKNWRIQFAMSNWRRSPSATAVASAGTHCGCCCLEPSVLESNFLDPRILKFFRVKRFGTLWIQAFWTRARQSTQPTRTICTEIDQNDAAMIEDFSSTFDFSSTVLPIDTTSDYSELHHRNLRQTSNLRVLEFARKSKRKLEKSLLENNWVGSQNLMIYVNS